MEVQPEGAVSNAPGYSVLVMGEPSTGKSWFLRSALVAEKSGAVALAPGVDEYHSYSDLAELEGFNVRGFDDFDTAVQWLKLVYELNKKQLRETGTLIHRVIGVDTYTGFDQLAVFRQLDRLGLSDIPKALTPDGADFYSGLRKDMELVTSWMRALRGLGMHWIATAHTQKKELDGDAAAVVEAGKSQWQPVFRGGFRSIATAPFDIVLHSEKKKGDNGEIVYALRWRSSAKKATKVRGLDGLGESALIRNEWRVLVQKLEEAQARRRAELEKQLGIA